MGSGTVRLGSSLRHRLRYVVGAGLVIACLALSGEPARITFIHPRSTVVLSGFYGTDIPVETRITPDTRNRVWALVWDGDGCGGSSMRTLDGENAPAIQPEWIDQKKPFTVRVGPGICHFTASVLGSGGVLLDRATLDVDVEVGQAGVGPLVAESPTPAPR